MGGGSGWLGRALLDQRESDEDLLIGANLKSQPFYGQGCSHNGAGFTSDLGPEIGALLSNWTKDGRASHLALWVDNDSSVVLEVDLVALSSPEGLALSDDDSWHDLLSEFWLTLLDGGEEQLTDRTLGQSVQTSSDHGHGNDVQVLGTSVVSAVHHAKGGQTAGNSEFDTGSSSSSSLTHCVVAKI